MNQRLSIRNPRTGEVDYWITPPTQGELAARFSQLREAQAGWRQGGLEKRIETFQQWKDVLILHRDELTKSLALDTGRWWESVIEFDLLLSTIDRWCRLAPKLLAPAQERPTSIPFLRLSGQLIPYSLIGVISPWNFPLMLSSIDAVPALLAGCAVVAKPSEVAPRFIAPLMKTITDVPGLRAVYCVIDGAGETGAFLAESVDAICFTGSVETGRKVGEAAARKFIPAFLELGGKDPALVLPSADLEQATSAILWGSVVNAGQSCLSLERIYVADSLFDQFVERLVEKTERLKLAYPSPKDGQIGPIIDAKQADLINEHLRDAYQKGAVARCGGSIETLGGGFYCSPTVLTHVDHSMKIMTEETFAPIMPVMAFSSIEEGIRLANETDYGLSAAVFAGTKDEARMVAEELEAGAVSINDACLTGMTQEGEKNSFKLSGLGGSRMGPASIMRFLRKKALIIKNEPVRDPWWFNI